MTTITRPKTETIVIQRQDFTPERLRELAILWQNDARQVYESEHWRAASPAFYGTARKMFEAWMEATRD